MTAEVDGRPHRPAATAIPPSSLHAIHRRVLERGDDVLPLHVGEPYLRMPAAAEEAFVAAIRDGRTFYTDAPGLGPLRERIAERMADNGAAPADRIFVTPGSCQAIAAVLQSVAFPGASAILPHTHWPVHLQQTLLAGLRPRFVPMTGTAGELVEALDRAYDPTVCVLVINSPANPSGAILGQQHLAAAHRWAADRGVFIVSDEAYEDFCYTGRPARVAELDRHLPAADRVVFSVHTFSKGYAMTGCRLGWVAAPTAAAAERLTRVQEATLVSPSEPVQHAGLGALSDAEFLVRHHSYVAQTRDAVLDRLAGHGLVWTEPAGGWYLLLDLGAHTDDSERFCYRLLADTGVALAPGYGFVPPGTPVGRRLARLTLCAERSLTLAGIDRLLGYLGSPP